MINKFYITTPIYYASGKPHIGHAFTTLYADVIARYQKILGKEVFFVTGTDEHGSKVYEKAREENKSPQQFVDEIAKDYVKAWKFLGIEYDDFIRTTSERHIKAVYEFIKKLKEAGDIYEDFYEGLYCVGCERLLFPKELVNGLCPDHLQPPQKIKEKNYFFNLKKYLPVVRKEIIENKIKIIPASRKNEILSIIDSNISNFSITREKVEWGILFPDDKNQTIYVWTEALMNYVTVLDFPNGEKYKKFWPADAHIIGAEINKFHSIFWPALLLSIKAPLPKAVFVHGLFTINGQKMSKTLGNVIDPIALVNEFGQDATRYLLLSQFSALEHGDVKQSDFPVKYNADLANGLGNLFERVFTLIINNNTRLEAKLPSEDARETKKKYHFYMENFQLFEALREIFLFVKKLDKYIDDKKPWLNPDPIVLNSLFNGIEEILEWLEPFMPDKTKQAQDYMEKIKNKKLSKDEKLNLFPRIKNPTKKLGE